MFQPRYGMQRVLFRIESAISHSWYLRGLFYTPWLSLSGRDRAGFKHTISTIIQEDMLGVTLQKAIADTIIDEYGIVHTQLPIYRYVRDNLCRGSSRQALALIQTWKERAHKPTSIGFKLWKGDDNG